ncbi:MAG: hypothetical protein ABI665_19655 [Vicinamibacterales bacterium]
MNAARLRRPDVLLTRHFLRQFLENDLIAPEADRSQLLAVAGALVVSLTLFISMFMSSGYVIARFTPGQAAVASLSDKFFYLAFAMIVTALVAAMQWDALSVDPRDAAILEPLPVTAATVRRAKLAAVAILGVAVAVLVNGFPSLIFPWLLSFNFRQLSVITLYRLILTHFAFTVTAAIFGYLSVVALRETTAAVLGTRWFTRVSPWLQGALIVALGSGLLLLPPASVRIGQRGFDGWRALAPPAWFLGAYELAAGGTIADLPRTKMTPRQASRDAASSALYEIRRQQFPLLASRVGVAFGALVLLASAPYLWNARRRRSLAPMPPPAFRRRWRILGRLANATLVRDPSAQAGFYFALAAMWRNNTHRLTLACATAAGFAMAVLALSNATVLQDGGASARLLSVQPLLYGALLVGFRHVIRVPAELRANWGFQLAWRNRTRAFAAGVKRAAIVALVLPALAIVLPLYVFVLGPAMAIAHLGLGLAGAVVLLETLMMEYDKVPFACTYVPSENMKALAPVYAGLFIAGASWFAQVEHRALMGDGALAAAVILAALFAGLRLISLVRPRPSSVDFDEAPATYQGLGLHT